MEHVAFGNEDIENTLSQMEDSQLDNLAFGAIHMKKALTGDSYWVFVKRV